MFINGGYSPQVEDKTKIFGHNQSFLCQNVASQRMSSHWRPQLSLHQYEILDYTKNLKNKYS